MQTDRYTKFVLTVIALCLLAIAIRDVDLIVPAFAQSSSRPPQMAGAGVYEVQIVGVDPHPALKWEPLKIGVTVDQPGPTGEAGRAKSKVPGK